MIDSAVIVADELYCEMSLAKNESMAARKRKRTCIQRTCTAQQSSNRVLNTDQGKHKGSTDDWRAVQPIRELKTSHHKNLYFFEVTALIGFKTKTVIKEIKQMRQFY